MKNFSPTPVQKKILSFFDSNPNAVESARGIATWLGESRETAEAALKQLVEARWLTVDETSSCSGYTLTQDERILSHIQETLK